MSIGQLPQSFRGYVGLGKESTYGTGVSPSYYVDATSDGFSLDNQPDYQNTTRGRATYKGEAGAFTDEGSIDLPANPENGLGLLLLAAFGSESFTASDPDSDSTDEVGEHVFSPADTLDALSVEVDRDTDTVRHLGAGVDALELSHTAEDMLTASVDLVAKEPDPDVSSTSPTYSDLRNFRWHDITLSVAGTNRDTDVTEATFSIENNLSSNFRGERTLSKLGVGERPVTATMSLDFESTELFELFLGADGATEVQDQLTTVAVDATWTSPETIEDTSTGYALNWNMPKCVINTHEATINQNDNVIEDVELRALYDQSLGAEAEVTLTNGITNAY
jgi:hypothetical protein